MAIRLVLDNVIKFDWKQYRYFIGLYEMAIETRSKKAINKNNAIYVTHCGKSRLRWR